MGVRGGGYATTSLRIYDGPPRIAVDVEEHVRECEHNRSRAVHQLRQEEESLDQLSHRFAQLQKDRTKCRKDSDTFVRQIKRLDIEIENLRESLREEEPANVSALVDAKNVEDDQYALVMTQLGPLEARKTQINELLRQLRDCIAEIERNIQVVRERSSAFRVCL